MWDTTKGIRTLQGAESALVRDAIHELVDVIQAAKAVDESDTFVLKNLFISVF